MVATTEGSLPSPSSSPSRSSSFFTTTSSHDDSTVLTGGGGAITSPNHKDYGTLVNNDELESANPSSSPQANMGALQADRPGYGTCSILSSSMNLVNAMMGSGIIGLPLALYLCGFWAGIAMSITIAGLTCMAMHLLVLSGVRSGQYTLADLCRVSLLGRHGGQAINLMLVFHTAGTAVSYYICKYKYHLINEEAY